MMEEHTEPNVTPPRDEDLLRVVEALQIPDSGRVFTKPRQAVLTAIVTSFLLGLFGGPALMAYGVAVLIDKTFILSAYGENTAWVMIGAGMIATVAGLTVCLYHQQTLFNYVYNRLIRRAIRRRADALVSPDDPEAIFVKWTPRDQWHEIKLDDAADVGLLKVDTRRGELRFEGDLYRHIVPADLITDCYTEFGGNLTEPFTLVVIEMPVDRVNMPEICYEYPQPRGMLSHWASRRRAKILLDRIKPLLRD